VRLTAEGRKTLARALPLWAGAHEKVVELLGPELSGQLRADFDAAVEATAMAAASAD
jgi:hypothetical protein